MVSVRMPPDVRAPAASRLAIDILARSRPVLRKDHFTGARSQDGRIYIAATG